MKMASSISGELWHRLVTRATTKVAGPEPSKGSRSRLDIDSPNFRRLAYSPTCLEEEFSEVHGSKLPWSGWPLGLWGGAMRPTPTLYLQGSPPMWQGIVASGYDLLRPRLTRISRLEALMKACGILATTRRVRCTYATWPYAMALSEARLPFSRTQPPRPGRGS